MLKINELQNDLNIGDYGENITNYDGSTYICDAITEIADNNTSIYYSDIKDFICNNVEEVEEAIQEFGWEGCGSDLMKAGQMGEFLQIERDIYDNLKDVVLYYAYAYLLNDLNIIYGEITEEMNEKIINECSNIDNNDRLDAITDIIDNLLDEAALED